MKIAYLCCDFGVPVYGDKGASVHLRQCVKALAGWGHEVLVLAANVGQNKRDPLPAQVACIELGPVLSGVLEELKHEAMCQGNRLTQDLRNLLFTSHVAASVAPVLCEFSPDLIYERYSLFGTAGLTLAQSRGVPIVLEVNAPLVEEQQTQRGLNLPAVARRTQQMLFAGCDHVLVVSDWLRNYVAAHGAPVDKITVLPNAADPEQFSPPTGPSPLRAALGWQDRFVVGFVGSMKSWHGVDTLLEALAILGGSAAPFRLALVGDGPELPSLRDRATELDLGGAVHFTGAVSHQETPDWVRSFDVAVAPYAKSAQPYFSPVKLFEYMATGRAIVAADIGQNAQLIEPDRTGWLYPPGDAQQLADRLQWLAAHPAAAAIAGEAARQEVVSRYTWRQYGSHILGLATGLIERRMIDAA